MTSSEENLHDPVKSALAHWDAYEWEYRLRHGEPSPLREVFVPEFREGGIEGAILAVGGDSNEHCLGHDDPLLGALEYQDVVRADLEDNPDLAGVVTDAVGLEAARAAGIPWFVLGLEGCRPLRGSVHVLEAFVRLGIRVIGLTWNGRNEAADGVGVAQAGGLTEFGKRVVEVANARGLLIDVSHLGERGLRETLELSSGPVMASHSNAVSLADHRRNLDDHWLRAIADADGVVGVSFISSHLRSHGQAELSDIVDQVAYMVELLGVDHVGLGPDFTYDPWRRELAGTRSYQGAPPPDMSLRHPIHRPKEMAALVAALRDRGFKDEEVRAVCSENVVRLVSQTLQQGTASAA